MGAHVSPRNQILGPTSPTTLPAWSQYRCPAPRSRPLYGVPSDVATGTGAQCGRNRPRHQPATNGGCGRLSPRRSSWVALPRCVANAVKSVLGDTFAGILGSDRLLTYLTYVVGQRRLRWVTSHRTCCPRPGNDAGGPTILPQRAGARPPALSSDPSVPGYPDARDGSSRNTVIAKVPPIEKRLLRSPSGISTPPMPTCATCGPNPEQCRKIMLGTRSGRGERAAERLLTGRRPAPLQELASRSEPGVHDRPRPAERRNSRPRFSGVGCDRLSLPPACHAGGRGFESRRPRHHPQQNK
jgi:hypothetical protein